MSYRTVAPSRRSLACCRLRSTSHIARTQQDHLRTRVSELEIENARLSEENRKLKDELETARRSVTTDESDESVLATKDINSDAFEEAWARWASTSTWPEGLEETPPLSLCAPQKPARQLDPMKALEDHNTPSIFKKYLPYCGISPAAVMQAIAGAPEDDSSHMTITKWLFGLRILQGKLHPEALFTIPINPTSVGRILPVDRTSICQILVALDDIWAGIFNLGGSYGFAHFEKTDPSCVRVHVYHPSLAPAVAEEVMYPVEIPG